MSRAPELQRIILRMPAKRRQALWSLSNLASMLRLYLFSYRELTRWIDNPMGTPRLIPVAGQLTLAWADLDRPRQYNPGNSTQMTNWSQSNTHVFSKAQLQVHPVLHSSDSG